MGSSLSRILGSVWGAGRRCVWGAAAVAPLPPRPPEPAQRGGSGDAHGRAAAPHPSFLSGLCAEPVLVVACSGVPGLDKKLNINSESLTFLTHSSFNRRRNLVFMSLLSRESAAPS